MFVWSASDSSACLNPMAQTPSPPAHWAFLLLRGSIEVEMLFFPSINPFGEIFPSNSPSNWALFAYKHLKNKSKIQFPLCLLLLQQSHSSLYRWRGFTDTFQGPVSQTDGWPKQRPGLRASSAHFVETESPQAHYHAGLCQHSLPLTNGYQKTASWCIRLLTQFKCWAWRSQRLLVLLC